MTGIVLDVRFALRQLRRSPSFAITAVVTLALGIGANVVAFGVLNAVLLKPLDVPRPDRLYNVEQQQEGNDNQSYPDYVDFRSRNHTFSDMAAYRLEDAGLSTGSATYKCWYYKVSGNYFDLLGANPQRGRFFHESDEHGPNSAPYIVLSEQFWERNFASDPNIAGTKVEINKHPFTVVGVAPREFHGNDLFIWPDFWMPIIEGQDYESTEFLTWRGNHNLWILGRVKPEVTVQQATEDLTGVAYGLAKQYPNTDDGLGARLAKPGLMGDVLGGPARPFIAGVMALALLVLLAACANLASLFAARSADRSRELAIRMAVGSSRWHIVRQLVTEAVVVACVGGALGTVLSSALLKALTRWQPIAGFPIHVTVNADARVYFVALVLSVGSGMLFGLVPLRQVWATSSAQLIKIGATGSEVFRRFTLREALLGIQIALCTLLVTASFVALRGMQRSLHAPLGFEPYGATLAVTDLHMGGYKDAAAVRVQKRMLDELGRLPDVAAVGSINETPLGTGGSSTSVYRPGTSDFRPTNRAFGSKYYSMSPGYFAAAGTHLLMGRDFTWQDDSTATRVAIVNERFARSLFGRADAIGERFQTGPNDSYQVVGVVENGKYDSLTESPWAAMFFPLGQNPDTDTTIVVRSKVADADMAPEMARVLGQIDPNVPFSLEKWSDGLSLVLFPARVATACLGVMGLLAAVLAVTGVFGLAMYSVSKRIREFGIRVALGALPRHVMRSALGRTLILLVAGSAAGLLLGALASQLLAQIVYSATPRDPAVFAGVVGTMILLGLLATWIPARRALGIDPARLLREE